MEPSIDYSDDPWSAPDVHKGHKHDSEPPRTNGGETNNGAHGFDGNGDGNGTGNGVHDSPAAPAPARTTSTFTTAALTSTHDSDPGTTRESSFAPAPSPGGAWGGEFFAGGGAVSNVGTTSPFGGLGGSNGGRDSAGQRPPPVNRTIGSGRTGSALEENIVVTLLPEKEGMFMFQHHNYEVASARRGSKVIRRYSDFVWLLDCLHKRYPFRVLPLLPPKRVAGTSRPPTHSWSQH